MYEGGRDQERVRGSERERKREGGKDIKCEWEGGGGQRESARWRTKRVEIKKKLMSSLTVSSEHQTAAVPPVRHSLPWS